MAGTRTTLQLSPREANTDVIGMAMRQIVDARRPAVGTIVMEFDSPGLGRILAAGGADFVFLDMEHSGFGIDTVKRVLSHLQGAGLPVLVRPPAKEYHHLAGTLDAGADGLVLPMVGTAEEARRIVAAMKYGPEGVRGVALGVAHDGYAGGPVAEKLAATNRGTVAVALIETAEGAANAEAIAAVDGIDALWLGHFDLSVSLGVPGQFDHPAFRAAVGQIVAGARRHNKRLGRMVQSVEEGLPVLADGFDLLCYSSDIWLLRGAFADGATRLRAAAREVAELTARARR